MYRDSMFVCHKLLLSLRSCWISLVYGGWAPYFGKHQIIIDYWVETVVRMTIVDTLESKVCGADSKDWKGDPCLPYTD